MEHSLVAAADDLARRYNLSAGTDLRANANRHNVTGTAESVHCAQATAENTPSGVLSPIAHTTTAPATSISAAIVNTPPASSCLTSSGTGTQVTNDQSSLDNMLRSTYVNNTAPAIFSGALSSTQELFSDPRAANRSVFYPPPATYGIPGCNTIPVWTKPLAFPNVRPSPENTYPLVANNTYVNSAVSTTPSPGSSNWFYSLPPSVMSVPSPITAPITSNNFSNCGPVPQNHLTFSHLPNMTSECTLSSSQIAARQVIVKDLPTFSGIPEEWPIFITNFVQSTERCGFSDQENLLRLQKSLKGQALQAVRGKLMMPSTVPAAIDTLKMLFGRADVIHQTMQRKLRQEPPIRSDKLENLVKFALSVQNYCCTIEAVGLGDYLNDPVLLNDLVGKLPTDLKLDWCRHQMFFPKANIKTFDGWLFNLATCVSHVTTISQPLPNSEEKSPCRQLKHRILVHDVSDGRCNSTSQQVSCAKCSGSHRLNQCNAFISLSITERWNFIRQKGICLRCLKKHAVRRCNLRKQCGVDGCRMPHHPLLHSLRQEPTGIRTEENRVVSFHTVDSKRAVFRYVPVRLHGKNKYLDTFALIDEGSACTLLESSIATELGLEGPAEELCLKWTGDISQKEAESKIVNLAISSRDVCARKFNLQNVRTVSSLDLPIQSLDSAEIQQSKHLRKLPILPYQDAQARVLIGLDNVKIGLPLKTREASGDELIAAKCRLGWTVYGRNGSNNQATKRVLHICTGAVEEKMDEMLKFWFSLDAVGVVAKNSTLQSKENERALRIMESTTKYIPSEKRWETGLLWKHDIIDLPDSLPMARRRLQCLESRMNRNPALKKFLVDTIKGYEERGYVRKVEKDEIYSGGRSWYLPMFTVTNPNKKKMRLVWDAAAKVDDIALNTYLVKGPDFLTSLVGVLIRFRERPIALCGDIREMFHQVLVRKEDQSAQKFLWREGDCSKHPIVYAMSVMTFGASCSPSLANFIRDKNADRWRQEYPEAVNAIVNNTYVDDWLQSVETEDEMIQLAKRVRLIHSDGGFEMRNWSSNSKRVLAALTNSDVQFDRSIEEFNSISEKVLGLWWRPAIDEFSFFNNLGDSAFDENAVQTKRKILRTVMTIFDPLGLLGFFVVRAKIILQDIWRSGVSWDEPIRDAERETWSQWVSKIPLIRTISIPRCFPLVSGGGNIELHTFVDASTWAYAAVCYVRAERDGVVCCSLIASKTRVTPLKPVSIPRLELMAAVLGLRLSKFVEAESSIKINRRFLWTDSRNVLCWIKSDARKFHQFVALRIGEILEDSKVTEWRWVPTALNVADDGTRWKIDSDIGVHSRWFRGPDFLYASEEKWPSARMGGETVPETETVCHITVHTTVASLAVIAPDPKRFSKWEKLRKSQLYVLQFLRKTARHFSPSKQLSTLLNMDAMAGAECAIIRTCQEEAFLEDLESLLSPPNKVGRKSSIFKLSPYLDDFGLLRARGRVDAVQGVPISVKRPVILSRSHRVTWLIIDSYHRRFHHHHNEIIINEVRQRFYVSGLRVLVRAVARSCQACKNRRAIPVPPSMGDLPPERLAPFTLPFTYTGVDYFGPLSIVVGRRTEKRWGVIFTCLTTRAVHLEISPSLSTGSFMLVLKQFISRRGVPRRIVSDNATNFRGASRLLAEEIERVSSSELAEAYPEIEWRFIPPAAPHMGGAWERMIRSVKSILMDILPDNGLREEVLRAALADVENILNSRPLTYVPLDSPMSEAITPNHFLVGSSSGIRERSSEDNSGPTLSKNFALSNQLANQFWKRWLREYLPYLTRRHKWFQPAPDPIVLGDVVIIVDESSKRNDWKKGVVMDLQYAKDGEARSAVVRTANGLMTRPIVKLAKLDLKKEQ